MKFRLLRTHLINELRLPAGTVVDDPPAGASPFMEGLDDEARAAVRRIKLATFGRYPWPMGLFPLGFMDVPPLDDPPIERELEENQPVVSFS